MVGIVFKIKENKHCKGVINHSLVRWGTPGNCSNHGEILKHPEGIKAELKYYTPWKSKVFVVVK